MARGSVRTGSVDTNCPGQHLYSATAIELCQGLQELVYSV